MKCIIPQVFYLDCIVTEEFGDKILFRKAENKEKTKNI